MNGHFAEKDVQIAENLRKTDYLEWYLDKSKSKTTKYQIKVGGFR